MKKTAHELIVVISEQGYTEMIMEAARAAGAYGGTVIHAKGTGQAAAEKFLGVTIAVEKEILYIVTKTEQKNAIMKAIMKDAGIDSLKIEGRMKSTYYVALVTRAYRKALDALDGKISQEEAKLFIDELENVSHRESTTGFYYSRADADKTTQGASDSAYDLSATIGCKL